VPDTIQGRRDRAILLVFVLTGRRRSEVMDLKAGDITIEDSTVYYSYRGKGGKRGRRELPRPCWEAIRRTLDDCGKVLATMDPEESVWQAGTGPKGLSGSTFYARIRRYLVVAGLQPTGLHILRHGAAKLRRDAGESSGDGQRLPRPLIAGGDDDVPAPARGRRGPLLGTSGPGDWACAIHRRDATDLAFLHDHSWAHPYRVRRPTPLCALAISPNASRWRLRLAGRDSDLELLARLPWGAEEVASLEDGAYYLDDTRLDDAVDADEAYDRGETRIAELNGALNALAGVGPVSLDAVKERDGSSHLRRFTADALIVAESVATEGGSAGLPNDPAPGVVVALRAATNDDRVALVLRQLSESLDWRKCRIIVETIASTIPLSEAESRGWGQAADIGRIINVASDTRASGDDAVHGVPNPAKKRPRDMTIEQARAIVGSVATQWILWMASGQPPA